MYFTYIFFALTFFVTISGMDHNAISNKDIESMAQLGKELCKAGHFFDGLSFIENALALQEQNNNLNPHNYVKDLHFVGWIYFNSNRTDIPCDYTKAWHYLSKAERTFDYFEDDQLKVSILHQLGRIKLYYSDDHHDADIYFLRAINHANKFPSLRPPLLLDLSNFYLTQKNNALQLKCLVSAIVESKDDTNLLTYATGLYQNADNLYYGRCGLQPDTARAINSLNAIVNLQHNSADIQLVQERAQDFLLYIETEKFLDIQQ